MRFDINMNAFTSENNTTGQTLKFDGGTIALELAPDELIKTLPIIKETIGAILGFEATENTNRRTHEMQIQNQAITADGYKRSLEETNAKLREENRQQREENRKLRDELSDITRNSGAKVPTKKELK